MKKTILIVDDSESIRNLVQFTLEKADFNIIAANNGKEALDIFKNGENIHLLLTDLHMPLMSGMELIEEVRKIETYSHIPILFLTTETQVGIKKQAKELGATGWIIKPFDSKRLITIIKKVIR